MIGTTENTGQTQTGRKSVPPPPPPAIEAPAEAEGPGDATAGEGVEDCDEGE